LLFRVVVSEFELHLIRFLLQAAVEVLLVEAIVEVKRVLLVFDVRPVLFNFGLLVVLRLQVLQELSCLGLAFCILFSISVLINLGQTLVLIV
jgi:hypothetical protein